MNSQCRCSAFSRTSDARTLDSTKPHSVIHQAWSDGSFFPIINRDAAERVPPDATLMWTIAARSWTEAMQKYHEFRGWEPYQPLDDDPREYTNDEELAAEELQSK